MKRILKTTLFLAALAFLASPAPSTAEEPTLPACAANGDMDADGVADADDSDEADSCLASSTGLEDCSTGAGDGIPDCQ